MHPNKTSTEARLGQVSTVPVYRQMTTVQLYSSMTGPRAKAVPLNRNGNAKACSILLGSKREKNCTIFSSMLRRLCSVFPIAHLQSNLPCVCNTWTKMGVEFASDHGLFFWTIPLVKERWSRHKFYNYRTLGMVLRGEILHRHFTWGDSTPPHQME